MSERILKKRAEGGFTLIELLIVIVILAILAAIVVFAVGTSTKSASVASCDADAKAVQSAIEAYHAQMGAYPAANNGATGWTQLTVQQTGPNGKVGPWLKSQPASTHYAINFDNLGNVSADPPSTATYVGPPGSATGDDITQTGGADAPCSKNAT